MRKILIAPLVALVILAPQAAAQMGDSNKVQMNEFGLLLSLKAYRCGDPEGAYDLWRSLSEQGVTQAKFMIALLEEWRTAAQAGSSRAKYALRVFAPGGGSAKECAGLTIYPPKGSPRPN